MSTVKPNLIGGFNLTTSPECYLTSMATLMKFNGHEGDALVNHHLGFIFRHPVEDPLTFRVRAFYNKDAYLSIHHFSGIKIALIRSKSWEVLFEHIQDSIRNGQPLIVFVDTFFIRYFPKWKGHSIHAVAVYGIDTRLRCLYVKSTMPGDWVIPFEDFRLACNSVGQPLDLQFQYLDFKYERPVKPLDVTSMVKHGVSMMKRKAPQDGYIYGLPALAVFLEWYSQCQPDDASGHVPLYNLLFKHLMAVVYQRRRYCEFLRHYISDRPDLCQLYQDIGNSCDVFRNMCFKIARNKERSAHERSIVRLERTIELEKDGVQMLDELAEVAIN